MSDAVRKCRNRILARFDDSMWTRQALEAHQRVIDAELRALVEGERIKAVTCTCDEFADEPCPLHPPDTLEARLVRLGHRPIHLKYQVEGCKWRWSCHVQEAHTMEWRKTVADTPSEAVAAAEREVGDG